MGVFSLSRGTIIGRAGSLTGQLALASSDTNCEARRMHIPTCEPAL